MTIAEMESRFFELKGKLAVGLLTEAVFKTELEHLRFLDGQSRWWMIGAQTGRWYYYDGARWQLGQPPEPGALYALGSGYGQTGRISSGGQPGAPSAPAQPDRSQSSNPAPTRTAAPPASTVPARPNPAPAQRQPSPGPAYTGGPRPTQTAMPAASGRVAPSPAPVPAASRPPGGSPALDPRLGSRAAAPTAPRPIVPRVAEPRPVEKPAAAVPVQDTRIQEPRYVAPQPVGQSQAYTQMQPYLPVPADGGPLRRTDESPSPYETVRKGRFPPSLVIGGAAVVGLLLVAVLLFVADQAVPGRPISTFLGRSTTANVTPTRSSRTPGPGGAGGSAANLIGAGDQLFGQGQMDAAIEQYQSAVRQEPNNPDALVRLSNALALVGRIAEASAAASKATQLDPNSALASAQLARALAWSGQNDAAIAAGEKAVTLDSANSLAHAFLSEAYLRAGRTTDAVKEAGLALQLNDQSAPAHRANGWILIVTGQKDQGVNEWNRVVELEPNTFFYQFELGEVLRVYLNDPGKSLTAYQRAIQLYPPYISSYISLGQAYLALNQPGNAILQFQKAITFDPNSAEAYGYLGKAFQVQGKCSQAIPYFQKSLALNGKFVPAASGLSDCGVAGQGTPVPTTAATPGLGAVPTAIVPATIVPVPASPSSGASKPGTTPGSSAAAGSALPGKIAFSIYTGNYTLFISDLNGGNRRVVAELGSQPAFSPDGSQLLYYSWVNDGRGVHRIETNGTEDEAVSLRLEDINPTWSPDGTKYAFASRAGQGSDVNARPFNIRVNDPTAKAKQDPPNLIEKAQSPAWSRQNKIAFRDCGFIQDNCGLSVTEADGSGKKVLTTINSAAPAWSPDGSRVAFMSDLDKGNWDIWLVAGAGGSPQRLTQDAAEDALPVWSPDGKQIAFLSHRDNVWALWVMNADGSNQRKLFDLGGDIFGPVKGNSSAQPGQILIEQRISWGK